MAGIDNWLDGLGDKDFSAQLVVLRAVTERTGIINEAQALQLRCWPFCVDPLLDKADATITTNEDGSLSKLLVYDWTGKGAKIDRHYKFRLKKLDEAIRFLLGKDWKLKVNLNGKVIYVTTRTGKSSRKPKRKTKRRPRTSK